MSSSGGCESHGIDVATWVTITIAVLSLLGNVANEILSMRRGDRNKQYTSIGDFCFGGYCNRCRNAPQGDTLPFSSPELRLTPPSSKKQVEW